ncbi:fimbrial protein [Acinetobacter rudis]|uniref:Fimbrial protein n=1 Tax=Acinetobacter rudis TaxID=632955 RepID=A0AAW8JBW3_9GAMM|nr:fimbrial protein [Acinetobacter rudis]MDQ8937078.1 fimbrial protein [Acinetobacter rudis]MDQ9019272.1 fimbrial protein [Acinetobacter rudis]
MKKIILALCALSTTHVFAEKQDGILTFNGSIYNATCAIDINNNGGSTQGSVDMGRHPTSAFPEEGSEAGGTGGNGDIKIKLADCPTNGTLEVRFDGNLVSGTRDVLRLDNPGSASTAGGIGIILLDEDDDRIDLDGSIAIKKRVTDSKNYTYEMKAKYYRYTDDDRELKAGDANSTVNFSIEYN